MENSNNNNDHSTNSLISQMCEHIGMIQSALENKIPDLDHSLSMAIDAIRYLQEKINQQEQVIELLVKHASASLHADLLRSGMKEATKNDSSSSNVDDDNSVKLAEEPEKNDDCGGRDESERAIDYGVYFGKKKGEV